MTPAPKQRPLRILVVASWYPSVDDVAAGRFVADQVAALGATGETIVEVVSFDEIALVGGATARTRQVASVHGALAAAIRSEPEPFVRAADGVGAPGRVARLAVAVGSTAALGTTSAAAHRAATLDALADRLLADTAAMPDVVHAHPGYPDGAAAAVLADRLQRPLVITEHATFLDRVLGEPGQRASYAAAGRRASRIVAVSRLLATQIEAALPELAERIVVVPNSVAVEEFRAPSLADRVADELLYVGYRKEIKGIDTLVEAFAIVRAARPAARLRLIGRSPSEEIEGRWRQLAADLGVLDAVSFEDVTDRSGVAAAMARASVFVHASRYETFGVVVAEALAAGMPVVATDSGGVGETLRPDPDALGALVAVGDAPALGAALIRTLDRRASFDPGTLRASVVERFGSRAVARSLVALYREVMTEAPAERVGRAAGAVAGGIAGVAETPERQPSVAMVVGLDRSAAAERLRVLPADLRAGLSLVTAHEPRIVQLPPLGRVVEVAVAPIPPPGRRSATTGSAPLDRLVRAARDPIGTLRRRATGDPLSPAALGHATRRVASALDELAGHTGNADPTEIVALDGRDVLVVSRLVAEGGYRLSPGGLRRLADVRLAAVERGTT